MKKLAKIFLLLGLACLTLWLLRSGLLQELTFENLKARQDELRQWTEAYMVSAILTYFVIYVATTAIALPGAAVLTLAGGAVFGLVTGTIIVSFASTMGATLCFLGSRWLFRDFVEKKFKSAYESVEKGLAKEGVFYLFTLRLIPAVPFFVINLVFGLTRMTASSFWAVSQIGMLPGTLAYVNAGTQLSQIESPRGILSLPVILSFALLGFVPWIAKFIVNIVKRRRVYRPYMRPGKFDYDVIVIGGGAAGLVSAYLSAALKAKVLLIEKHRMGGDCLYTGCVPSKALIRSAHVAHLLRRANEFGMQSVTPQVDFSRVFTRIHNIIAKIEPNDSVERYTGLGVECLKGTAKIADPFRVHVDEKILTTRNIIIATGATPMMPKIPGLQEIPHYTSDTLWQMTWVPKKLLVVGGGPIGCELAQAFTRLGCETTVVEQRSRLLRREDPEVSEFIYQRFKSEGVKVLLETEVNHFERAGNGGRAHLNIDEVLEFDAAIVALGRKANTEGLGLGELGIGLRRDGTVETDSCMRTTFPNVLACGDVAGPFQFTHAASFQAGYAVLNALFAPFKSFRADYSALPWCTYTDPEVARVGLNETDAGEQGIEIDVHRYELDHLDRAICESENQGMIKVVTPKGSGKILGVTIVGAHAGDTIPEFVLAIRKGMGLNDVLNTVHAYPTFAEANRFVAGVWKKKTASAAGLKFLERFHAWRRG
jgi:pyruvate/2-oxoglutarate dehydrogenase complex dihydrolipoamide dehydrogenase (E3) component/uncharacterized membrane protein YdjX (TVP38/TMEM64 family)